MEKSNRKLKVLVIAEACNPDWTSVPLVGYNVVNSLASRDDLEITVATHPRNREQLDSDRVSDLAEVIYPDNEYVAKRFYNFAQLLRGNRGKGWTTNTAFKAVSYLFFERELFQLVGQRLENGEFDLIHRVTPVSPTMSSPIASWSKVPMIIGPLNGGLPWPDSFPELREQENEFLVPLRKAYKRFPYYRGTYKKAKAVIAGSRHTASEIPKYFKGDRHLMPENGVAPERFPIADTWTEPKRKFRFVTVGRLVPYKGVWLTLEAFRDSAFMQEHAEFHVIGDGPERSNLEKMAEDYGLSDIVKFCGWMDQEQLGAELRESQAFVFPSLREFGGGVVLEAMASGLPSIIVDYGGPAELLNQQCGILLPMQPAADLVFHLRESMECLVKQPEVCVQFAENAIRRIKSDFTWEAKAERLTRIYGTTLGIEGCSEPCITESAISVSTY